MKKIFKTIFMIGTVILVYIYRNNISTFIIDEIVNGGSNKVLSYNEYYRNDDFLYVQNIDTREAKSYQELLNMIYTTLNSGDDSFSFKCSYNKCISDMKNIIDNTNIIANINNFVHPYNSFSTVNIDISTSGLITINSKKIYKDNEIEAVNNYIDDFISQNINDEMDIKTKIKLFHDNIINNTVYDENSNDSYTAYTLINTGKAICSGYSDILAIYLTKLGIKNYKITSENHVWNLVNIDNKWLHIDMTWDDPVASDGNQYLIDNFFLIDTNKLIELDTVEHNYNKEIYLEAN